MADQPELDALFDRTASLAARPRTIRELPGGLTNRNYQVSTPGGRGGAAGHRVPPAGPLARHRLHRGPDAGLLFACKLTTGVPFLGQEAVEQARDAGPRRRLISLVLTGADPDAMIWGGELVLRDGVAVGQLASGAWGEAVGACVGLPYVRHPEGHVLTPGMARAGEYQVNAGGRLYPAAVHLRAPFDPAGDRIKGRYPDAGGKFADDLSEPE